LPVFLPAGINLLTCLTWLPTLHSCLVAVEAGEVVLGKPANFPSFGWDNEYGCRSFNVRPFRATRALVR
jgi:hypothetical protein